MLENLEYPLQFDFKLIALSIQLMCIWMKQAACKPTGRFIFGILIKGFMHSIMNK